MENMNCCTFNKMIDCTERKKCNQCGWNPKVAAERLREWKKNRELDKE